MQGTQTFYAKPKDVIDVALAGIVNVLTFAELCHNTPPDLVLVSSSEVYQNPPEGMFPTDEPSRSTVPDVTNPRYSYGAGKIASEVAAMAYSQAGILGRAVIVRPHNIYGPDIGWDHVIPQFAQRLRDADSGGEFRDPGVRLRNTLVLLHRRRSRRAARRRRARQGPRGVPPRQPVTGILRP